LTYTDWETSHDWDGVDVVRPFGRPFGRHMDVAQALGDSYYDPTGLRLIATLMPSLIATLMPSKMRLILVTRAHMSTPNPLWTIIRNKGATKLWPLSPATRQ
jgi:hypothetical protein